MLYFPIIEHIRQHPIYHQPDTNNLIFPIPKTGHSTLNHWYRDAGWEQRILSHLPKWSGRGVDGKKLYEVSVFLREPEDRFWAGMVNAFPNLISDNEPQNTTNILVRSIFLNHHLFPQLFYLMLLHDYCPDCYITFHSYKKIGGVLKTKLHQNKTDSSKRHAIERVMRDQCGVVIDRQLEKAYYPDQILWREFLGKRVHFDDIRQRMSQEKEFFASMSIGIDF